MQKALAEAIQSDLGRIGIAARLLGTDAATLQARQRSGDFGLVFTETWGPPYDPHAFLGAMRAPSHADWQAQRGLPMKAAIDRRITALLAATNATAREADEQWVLTTLHEQAVYFPISFLTNKQVHRKGLGEVPFGGTFDEIPSTASGGAEAVLAFALRRVLTLLPLLLLVSVVFFAMLRLGRGDPALDYLRLSQIPPTEAALALARQQLGLDRSLPAQYLAWLADAARLDFGTSWATQRPVLEDILQALPATLQLAGAAMALVLLLGLPLGLLAALYRDRWPDHLTRAVAFLGVSLPNFWLGFLLVLLFSVQLGWLPAMGREGPASLILPAIATATVSLCVTLRLMRASVLGVLGERHLVFARARGLPERA
ncbi:ABC transporter permease subunit [Pseudoroseomonas wenyumeiae]